ncbi:hypothetical protein T4A_8173 [Trichinella pseudospiralis]|uniref:Uncharacterized protein n=1 Tax=Trichinella pseudospiralis TaxID=6337 RepID=A0A0V1EM66_TRIPS|nr:hypothetical protein T4A_8173 [Trichinella pseudospiralis]
MDIVLKYFTKGTLEIGASAQNDIRQYLSRPLAECFFRVGKTSIITPHQRTTNHAKGMEWRKRERARSEQPGLPNTAVLLQARGSSIAHGIMLQYARCRRIGCECDMDSRHPEHLEQIAHNANSIAPSSIELWTEKLKNRYELCQTPRCEENFHIICPENILTNSNCWQQRSVANNAVDCRLFSAAGQTNYDRLTAILPTFDHERVTNKTNKQRTQVLFHEGEHLAINTNEQRLGTTQNQEQSHGTVKKSLTTTAASSTLRVTPSYRTPPTVLIVKFDVFRFQH